MKENTEINKDVNLYSQPLTSNRCVLRPLALTALSK